ncbi:MAG: NAD-dependent epimerase/dehydratase family protein [Candidatus Yonathbacteria bacterium]|nr:NAD-dependent epimerase/dehydratase family protein [Candidatus Yonathbacteria bacterium]
MEKQVTIFITGGAGYVGAMLADQFSKRPDVKEIILLDKEAFPDLLSDNSKIFYIQGNTSDGSWQEVVALKKPEVVVHTAWQIREMYGNQKTQWKWNIDGSNAVSDFAFNTPSVKKFIYFSTVASYGAFPENTIKYAFTEKDPFRKVDYLYAEEKRIAEENLLYTYEHKRDKGEAVPQVFIIRPAAITGPRGRYARIRFGLQSALSGTLRGQKSFWYNIVSLMVSWVPVTPKWLRQYIHEDDIIDIVALFSFNNIKGEYEVFNAAPPGPPVLGLDMARAVGKRMLLIHPYMVRIVFFVLWHLTRGRISTARGSWKGYSYPIKVDGSKITKQYGYQYAHESREAFVNNKGRYEADAIRQ